MYDNCVLVMNVVDEDVHGLFFWWKPLCYSSKCIQDKDGTRMVLNSLFFFLFDKKVTLRILCKAKLINKLLNRCLHLDCCNFTVLHLRNDYSFCILQFI